MATTKFVSAAVLIVLAAALIRIVSLPGYGQQTERAKILGKRLMCMCGCNQILTARNHVGRRTLQSLIQEYGEIVLAAPPAKGFNRLAGSSPASQLRWIWVS